MPRNMMLVVNPYSGRGLSRTAVGTIVSKLCNSGYIVTVYYAGESTPEQLAYDYAKHHELAVCVGGDGTLSSLVSGIMQAGVSIPVGYIPAGTANDMATTLALSKFPAIAAETIIKGNPRPLDVGMFYDKYFTYIAAFGAFTDVAYSTPQSAKRALGHFAYVLGGLSDMSAIKAMHTVVEYDGKTIQDVFIFGGVVNTTSIAGLVKLDPELVDLADGKFEVILVKQPIILADFMDILAGVASQTYDGDNVQVLHASNVKFWFKEKVPWTIDGEDGGMHSKAEIKNCHRAISIIA